MARVSTGGTPNYVTDPEILALLGGGQPATPLYNTREAVANQYPTTVEANPGITTPQIPTVAPPTPPPAETPAATPTTPAPMDKETARRILSGAQAGDTKAAQEAYYGTNGLGGAYGQATGNAAVTDPNQEQALAAHAALRGGTTISDTQRAAAQGTMDAWYAKNPLFEKDVQGTYTGGGGKDPYAMNNQQWGTETAQDYALQQIKRLLGDKFDPATMKISSVGPSEGSPYQWQPQRTININGREMNVGEIAKWYQGRDQTTADAMLRGELQGAGLLQGVDQYGNAGGTPTYTGQAPASDPRMTQARTAAQTQYQQPAQQSYQQPAYGSWQQPQYGFQGQQQGQYGNQWGQQGGPYGQSSYINPMGFANYAMGNNFTQYQQPQQNYGVQQQSQLGYTNWAPLSSQGPSNASMASSFYNSPAYGQSQQMNYGGVMGMQNYRMGQAQINPMPQFNTGYGMGNMGSSGSNSMGWGGNNGGYGGGMYGGSRGGGMMGGQGYSGNTPYINNAMFGRQQTQQGYKPPPWQGKQQAW
jgi:hypothetical protein